MSVKRIIAAVLTVCLVVSLAGCSVNLQVGRNAVAKTLKGDKGITENQASLGGTEYKLIVEDIMFTGSNASGKIIIDESLGDMVTLSTDENILGTITITADNDRITVRGDKDYKYDHTEFELRVGAKVNEFKIDGGFELVMDVPSVTSFSGIINGAVDAKMRFNTLESFSLELNGAGEINITGETDSSSITVNGAGSIEAFDFRAKNMKLTVNGTGSCGVYASDTLDVSMNGIGSIVYDGNPSVSSNKGFLGSLRAR